MKYIVRLYAICILSNLIEDFCILYDITNLTWFNYFEYLHLSLEMKYKFVLYVNWYNLNKACKMYISWKKGFSFIELQNGVIKVPTILKSRFRWDFQNNDYIRWNHKWFKPRFSMKT